MTASSSSVVLHLLDGKCCLVIMMKSIKLSLTLVMSKDKFKKLAEYKDGTVIYEEEIRTITTGELIDLYNQGDFTANLNLPVPSTGWSIYGWINWINETGRWWLDDCFWEKVKGTDDQFKTTRSSGFLNRYKKELDAALKKDK